MPANAAPHRYPRTEAARRALRAMREDAATQADLLFFESWEANPSADVAAALRASQIRRANPLLATEIRVELRCGRPLSEAERAAIAALV